jgi:hypothetical protein
MTTENNQGTDPVEKGRKGRKRTRTADYVAGEHMHAHMRDHHATPAHAAAEGHQDVMEADCGKAGNPVDVPDHAANRSRSNFDRSSGGALAYSHENLRQSSTTILPWQTARTVNGDNECMDRDITHPRGTAVVRELQVQHQEQFTSNPSGNPNVRAADHSARNSATPSNGTHVAAGNVTSNAVKSSALDIMKAALFGHD